MCSVLYAFFADLDAPPLLPVVGFKNKRKFHYCSSAAAREKDELQIQGRAGRESECACVCTC